VRRGAWSVISLASASPAIGHCPLFPRRSPSQSPAVGASPGDLRSVERRGLETLAERIVERRGLETLAERNAEWRGLETLAERVG